MHSGTFSKSCKFIYHWNLCYLEEGGGNIFGIGTFFELFLSVNNILINNKRDKSKTDEPPGKKQVESSEEYV